MSIEKTQTINFLKLMQSTGQTMVSINDVLSHLGENKAESKTKKS